MCSVPYSHLAKRFGPFSIVRLVRFRHGRMLQQSVLIFGSERRHCGAHCLGIACLPRRLQGGVGKLPKGSSALEWALPTKIEQLLAGRRPASNIRSRLTEKESFFIVPPASQASHERAVEIAQNTFLSDDGIEHP